MRKPARQASPRSHRLGGTMQKNDFCGTRVCSPRRCARAVQGGALARYPIHSSPGAPGWLTRICEEDFRFFTSAGRAPVERRTTYQFSRSSQKTAHWLGRSANPHVYTCLAPIDHSPRKAVRAPLGPGLSLRRERERARAQRRVIQWTHSEVMVYQYDDAPWS